MLEDTFHRIRGLFKSPRRAYTDCAVVLSGGGARASYQAGVLQYISQVFPEASFPILTGVSAGAINAAQLANHVGTFPEAANELMECWLEISLEEVFEAESSFSLFKRILGKSVDPRHLADTVITVPEGKALVDTSPLRTYLEGQLRTEGGKLTGIAKNLETERLKAVCLTGTNYQTGQTVTWVQGRNIKDWQRPNRVGVQTTLTVDHIMASTALPLLFPAVRVGNAWFGDGGIRLSSPLSPAVHLGADSIFVISTRYGRSRREADAPSVVGYPPAAQIVGLLMNAIFLDVLDQDATTMRRINHIVRQLPLHKRNGFRPIKLFMMRPSQDLGKLASEYELKLHGALRLLTRGIGSGETKSPDWLSMLLFDADYIARLTQIGWEDARRKHNEIARFLDPDVPMMTDEVEIS
ncbi:MAG TPA: patatin-like phospholipase family protein [Rhodothermales bacterium]|nr:patatin-like phospholipase family protein [Rhodothermales bacterium]